MTTIIIGGGASGLFSAYSSALKGNKVILIEKNEKLGKKIYITGKGRCNLTNNVLPNEFINNVVVNSKFLFSAINNFSSQDVIDFFQNNGLKLKIERGNRVFPESDHASDVTKTLEKVIRKLGVEILLNTNVTKIEKISNEFKVYTDKDVHISQSVIVCTGGLSYPLTGSTGDGYIFAKHLGHNIIKPIPALCGIQLKGNDFSDLQGLSLKNVGIKFYNQSKVIYQDFGEMLFTHFGISGPIILSASSIVNKFDLSNLRIVIDLKPALSDDILDNRLIKELNENSSKEVCNMLRSLMPKQLILLILKNAGISSKKICSQINKEERTRLIFAIKNLTFNLDSLRNIDEAIVTSGGVNVKEINPKTMESKLVKGLFFAGEVIDVDAFTGGFNLQIAFSTGYLAGQNS